MFTKQFHIIQGGEARRRMNTNNLIGINLITSTHLTHKKKKYSFSDLHIIFEYITRAAIFVVLKEKTHSHTLFRLS